MPWNPSDPNKNKDPWGRDKTPQGPPDLHAVFKQFKNKLFGGGRKAGGASSDRKANTYFTGLIVLAVVILWILSGIFIVSPAERAVITRFGKYVETVGPGPHWLPRFIESKFLVNVQHISNFAYAADMLTKDENIVSVSVVVQYRIINAQNYLFNVVDANSSLEQATASALRQAVGHNTLDDLLTTGRSEVRQQVAEQLQQIINVYKAGLVVTDVTLQSVKPPEPVTSAFDDVIKAREDQKSYINKANTYANQVSANAQGQIARISQEAQAYLKEVVLNAQASTVGFTALLPEYQKSPAITRERLYLTTMETIFAESNKILLDQKSGNPLLYLPLDKMLSNEAATSNTLSVNETVPATSTTNLNDTSQAADQAYPPRGRNQ